MKNYIEYEGIKIFYAFAFQEKYINLLIKYLNDIKSSLNSIQMRKNLDKFYYSLNPIVEYCKIDLDVQLQLIDKAAEIYEDAIYRI